MDYTKQDNLPSERTTEKRERMLELLPEHNYNPIEAAKAAGYADPYSAVKGARKQLIEVAENMLATAAPQAVFKMIEALTSDKPIPQGNIRLKAAESILDRTGLGKKETVDVNHKTTGGVFLFPDKKPIVIEGEVTDVE